jgi:hypothetical protein
MPPRIPDSEPEFTLDAVPSESVVATGSRAPVRRRAKTAMIAGFGALALVVVGLASYALWPRGEPRQQRAEPPAPESAAAANPPSEPAIRYPVEKLVGEAATTTAPAAKALPALDDSDTVARDAIEAILNSEAFVGLLVPNAIIRHIVATVDSLPRKLLVERIRPIKPVPGLFATENGVQGVSIARINADRYATFVKAAESIDTGRLVEFYVRLYPLFQQAYLELGYPRGYFNDRLISVIDHLLDAPEISTPVLVSQPKILYEFVDPELADLSAGHKILVRIGLDNELRLKAKLRGIRAALTRQRTAAP